MSQNRGNTHEKIVCRNKKFLVLCRDLLDSEPIIDVREARPEPPLYGVVVIGWREATAGARALRVSKLSQY